MSVAEHPDARNPRDGDAVVSVGSGEADDGSAAFAHADAALRATAARLRLLADAGRALGGAVERDAACAVVADLLTSRVADVCTIDIADANGQMVRVAAAATDPALLDQIPAPTGRDSDPTMVAARAIRELAPVLSRSPITPSLGAVATVPLLERGQPAGVITIAMSATVPQQIDDDTLALLDEMARRLAVTLERIRLLTDAQTARHDAEHANRAKSQFLATMSHELRTPLNAILGYADLLDAGVAGPLADPQHRYVDRIRSSGRHLLGLIDDVLDFAKLDAGTLIVAREMAPIADVLSAADALVRPQSRARHVDLRVAQPPLAVRYVGDEARVRQILVNLLSNAIKFTVPGGIVSVECGVDDSAENAALAPAMSANDRLPLVSPPPTRPTPAGGWLCIRVRDTGIGIAADALDRIFEPFVQVDASRTRTAEGTGLGLAISRQFANRMQGDLTVASEPGYGSVFALWLPLAAPEHATTTARTRTRTELGRLVLDHISGIVAQTTARLRTSALVPNRTIVAQTDLENHLGTFLADFAQQFTILDEEGADAVPLVRDGSELQNLLVNKHGRQRRRLGWPESALTLEFDVLADEIAQVVRAHGTLSGDDLDDVLALVAALLDEALRASLVGYRADA